MSADASRGAAKADVTGGAGVGVTIDPDGATTIDFTGMQPIAFTAGVGTADIRGNFTYAGRATGTMTTGPGSSPSTSPSGGSSPGTTGTWQPAGDIDWGQTRLTLDLTEPVQARPLDNVAIGRYTGDAAARTGNVVDVDPAVRQGPLHVCR